MKIYRMTEKPNNISKLFISIFFYIENNISKIKKKVFSSTPKAASYSHFIKILIQNRKTLSTNAIIIDSIFIEIADLHLQSFRKYIRIFKLEKKI